MINRKKFLQGFEIERMQNELAWKNKNEWKEEKWDQENVKEEDINWWKRNEVERKWKQP